jgi:hypothetical protein
MDTTIQDTAVAAYYNAYIANYILDEPWLRFIFVRCDKEAFVKEIETWMTDSLDLYNLEDFCSIELQVCHLKPNQWISLKIFSEKMDGIQIDENKISAGNVFLKIKEGNLHYLIRVLEFKNKGEAAPLTFVERDIKSILRNKKKREFLNAFQHELISTETLKGNVKIYGNE